MIFVGYTYGVTAERAPSLVTILSLPEDPGAGFGDFLLGVLARLAPLFPIVFGLVGYALARAYLT